MKMSEGLSLPALAHSQVGGKVANQNQWEQVATEKSGQMGVDVNLEMALKFAAGVACAHRWKSARAVNFL